MLALDRDQFPHLLDALRRGGYRVVGPTVRDGVIVYDEIDGPGDLPVGWTDEQAPGRYRLRRRDDEAYFGYVVGPHSWKKYVFPPREALVRIRRQDGGFVARRDDDEGPPLALIGVRGCELAGLNILDRVFIGGPYSDPRYRERRTRVFIVAVDCLESGELCFCWTMGTGPEAAGDFDLRLTELDGKFLLEIGSDRGEQVASELETVLATPTEREQRQDGLAHAADGMSAGPALPGLPELLLGNVQHPRWTEVAERCLACGNCTQVCPTCFCHTIADRSVVGSDEVVRERTWDSCFGVDHGTIHGASFRPAIRDRYRQWLTHKLGSWNSQFGVSGCVGCGRCIAWCPVGIDLREEIEAIRADPAPPIALPAAKQYAPEPGDALVPSPAHIAGVRNEHDDVVTLFVEPSGPFRHLPGQFNMVSVPGVGDIPISIAGRDGSRILHTIRAVGSASRALLEQPAGAQIGLRGPFGRGWPLDMVRGHDVTVIAGGIGLAPLREILLHMLGRPAEHPRVRLLYGARSPGEVLYDEELLRWNRTYRHFKASVTVDHATGAWTGHVGVVTSLMRRKDLSPHGVYLLCGPEAMMHFVIGQLRDAGVPDDRIYVSMERNMKCAIGQCGRCQYGPHFICKDGPVFRYDEIEFLFGSAGY